MSYEEAPLVNWSAYADARATMGSDFLRILGYFREDGVKSVDAIESAMRERSAARLVLPAHTLKSEAHQFGAERLGLMSEKIEMVARHCVETHVEPDELIEDVVSLRETFLSSLTLLEKEANPLVERRTFGRRLMVPAGGLSAPRSFGRA